MLKLAKYLQEEIDAKVAELRKGHDFVQRLVEGTSSDSNTDQVVPELLKEAWIKFCEDRLSQFMQGILNDNWQQKREEAWKEVSQQLEMIITSWRADTAQDLDYWRVAVEGILSQPSVETEHVEMQ
jgi:hypothetical protein